LLSLAAEPQLAENSHQGSERNKSGRCIQKSAASATMNYLYDGVGAKADVIEEVDLSGNLLARYTQGAVIDEPLAELLGSTPLYYEADGLGSISSLSNSSAALAGTYTFDSFGKLTASTGALSNPFQYTAREFDPETGIYEYRARYYDQSTGRFISADPIRMMGGINFYAYVKNRPIVAKDPSGLVLYLCSRPAFWQNRPYATAGANHSQVWAPDFAHVRGIDVIVHHATEMVTADRLSILREKQRHIVRLDDEPRPDFAEVFFDPCNGTAPDWHHTVFLALTLSNEDRAVAHVDVVEFQLDALAAPYSSRVKGFDDGPISESLWSGHVRLPKDPLDFIHAEHVLWQIVACARQF
jgi:RHS repeat-associated protein